MGIIIIKVFVLKTLSLRKGVSGTWFLGPDTDKVDKFCFVLFCFYSSIVGLQCCQFLLHFIFISHTYIYIYISHFSSQSIK